MRVLVEVLHIVAGVFAALLIATLSSWAYPRGREDIWLVTIVVMAASVAMGVRPVLRAIREDRLELQSEKHG